VTVPRGRRRTGGARGRRGRELRPLSASCNRGARGERGGASYDRGMACTYEPSHPARPHAESTEAEADCRVCLATDAVENLLSPCNCDGSVRYVHKECLRRWALQQGRVACEMCGATYRGTESNKLIMDVQHLENLKVRELLLGLPALREEVRVRNDALIREELDVLHEVTNTAMRLERVAMWRWVRLSLFLVALLAGAFFFLLPRLLHRWLFGQERGAELLAAADLAGAGAEPGAEPVDAVCML